MTKHGLHKHPLNQVFRDMKQRCYNDKNEFYYRYGERGIKICDEWLLDFMNFYNWSMSNEYKKGLQIDRKNNDGNYEPENCRFVTSKINNNNKSTSIYLIIFNETKTISQWSEDSRCIVTSNTFVSRLKTGWNPEQALLEPAHVKLRLGKLEAFGKSLTIKEWSKDPLCKAKYTTLKGRLQKGWALEDALTQSGRSSTYRKK